MNKETVGSADGLNQDQPRGGLRLVLFNAFLATAYALAGYFGQWLAISPGYATAVWPPSGIALAALLLCGARLWPGVLIGSFLVNLNASLDPATTETMLRSSILAFSISCGAALQALAGNYLVRRYVNLKDGLVLGRDVSWFLGLGGPLSCVVSASWGVTMLWSFGLIADGEYFFSWVTWWIGDSIGVLLVVPMIFCFFAKPVEIWKLRRVRVAIPMFLTLIVTISVFVVASRQAQLQVESDFRARATILGDSLEKLIEKNIEVLYSIQGLFSRPDLVTHDEFQRYVQRALARNSGIQALSWNPVITHRQRPAFELEAKSRGLSELGITERDAFGQLVSAQQREKYVVVSYIAPLQGNLKALGFDVYSNPERRLALDEACRTGDLSATDPIRLVQESGNQNGVLFFLPVYQPGLRQAIRVNRCDRLVGYVVGVFRAGNLLKEAVEALDSTHIGVHLVDNTNSEQPMHLAYSFSSELIASPLSFPASFSWRRNFEIGQRSWRLKIDAGNEYIASRRSWAAWGILTGGLLFTALLGLYLLTLTGRVAIDQRRAKLLSAEISQREKAEIELNEANRNLEKLATTDPLTQIYNRRFIQQLANNLDAETRRHQTEYSIMILDIDFFKRVNDTWGHQIGDDVLQEVTRIVGSQLRETDYFGRWGGEEFIVVARNSSFDDSIALAERLCDSMHEHEIEKVGRVTLSIGVASNLGKYRFDQAVKFADDALYTAKEKGRDRVESTLTDKSA